MVVDAASSGSAGLKFTQSNPESGKSLVSQLVPKLSPPYFEDQFIQHAQEDVALMASSPQLVIIDAGAVFAGLGTGANDFANAMATSVGSGVLTLSQARTFAGAAVIYGALFGGKQTSETFKKDIWDVGKTTLDSDEIQYGLGTTLLVSSAWNIYATALGLPVSSNHATASAIAGVGCVAQAVKSNNFDDVCRGVEFSKFKNIGLAWVTSPLAGGVTSAVTYGVFLRGLFHRTQFNPVANVAWRTLPVVSGLSVAYSIGQNDKGLVVGPLAGGIEASKTGSLSSKAHLNQWLGGLGGWLIFVGMRNWGEVMTDSLGSRVGNLNPAKALAAEISTAAVLTVFSQNHLPISSSHTIVGSVVGVVLASGQKVPLFFLGNIAKSWIVTIPVSAFAAGAIYAGASSVAKIDRSAPPVEDHAVSDLENSATLLMRSDNYLQKTAKAVATDARMAGEAADVAGALKVAKKVPLGGVGVATAAYAMTQAAKEGPRPVAAQWLKTGVEVLPYAGGIAQAADGVYALFNKKSSWTGLEVNTREALSDIGLGIAFTALDVFGPGLVVKVFRGAKLGIKALLKAGAHADDITKVAEGAAGAASHLAEGAAEGAAKVAEGTVEGAAQVADGAAESAGLVGKARKAEDLREAARVDTNKFVDGVMAASYEKIVARSGLGRAERVLLRDNARAAMQKAGRVALRNSQVAKHAELLIDKVERELSKLPGKEAALKEVRAAIDGAHKAALKSGNIARVEKAVLPVLKNYMSLRDAEGLLKFVRKHLPEGQDLIASNGSRELFARSIGSAVDEVAGRYMTWRRYAYMGYSAATEPLTLTMTVRGVGNGLRYATKNIPHMSRSIDTAACVARDWRDTLVPHRSIRLLLRPE